MSPVSSNGNRYILVVSDLFTKWVEAFAIKETSVEVVHVARILVDEVICRYGVPQSLHSDQGRNFCGHVVQSLCDMLGIKRTNTSHSRSNFG